MYYAILLACALILNMGDRRMLVVSLAVGVNVFAPIPAANFYLICALAELLVGLIAYRLAVSAAPIIVWVCGMMIGFHFLGYVLNGYPPDSPYRPVIKICEYANLIACIVFSNPILRRPKNAA